MVHDVIIAGGGIAGLSAGLAAARLGRSTLILTGDMLGGQLVSINQIDGYPGFPQGIAGYDLCPQIQEQAAEAGAEFGAEKLSRLERQDDVWQLEIATGERLAARTVIVATGARLKELGIPGEARLYGHGVSHCASCDGPMLRGRDAAVIGGGDSALQEALTLAEFAGHVTIIQNSAALTAQASYLDRVRKNAKITVRHGTQVAEILGDSAVSSIRLTDDALLDVAAVFAYIGLTPNADFLQGLLQLGAAGGIPTDAAMCTTLPGLFAAGAVRQSWQGRAVLSAAEGTQAALGAHRLLTDAV